MKKTSLIAFLLILVFSSCNLQLKKKTCGEGNVCISIARFDKAVDDYVRTGNFSFLQRLSTIYPNETRILVENVLHLGSIEDPNACERLRSYYCSSDLQQLSRDMKSRYNDLGWLEFQLSKAFSGIKRDCPDFKVPHVYAQNSALNESVVVNDTMLGISLDKYMGSDYRMYLKYYPAYMTYSMDPSRIVPDCLSFYLEAQYPIKKNANLLENIIYIGKIQWIISTVTQTQYDKVMDLPKETEKWCRHNEKMAWNTLKRNKVLHTTDSNTIYSILFNPQIKPYFKSEASRGFGAWIGLQITEKYMQRHPNCNIGDLLKMTDYNKLLRESGYNPE